MKYIKDYNSYISENFDYSLILEDKNYSFYKTTLDKTINKIGLNLYFVATYTMGVTMVVPIVEALLKNSNIPNLTPEQIVLLTLFSIAQILYLRTEDVKKIENELNKNNLLPIADKVKKSLMSVQKIASFVGKSFGKIIDVFTDMFFYVGLGVPLLHAIHEMISQDGLNLDTLPQKAALFGGSAALFGLKSMIETLIIMVKNKMNSKKQR